MQPYSPQPILTGLPAIAEAFGVSVATVQRRLRADRLPEAEKQSGGSTDTWSLDLSKAGQIADREGWVIDLALVGDQVNDRPYDQAELEQLAEALAARRIAELELGRANKRIEQQNSDIEAERTQIARLETDLRDTRQEHAKLQGRSEELDKSLERERQERDAAEVRHNTDLERLKAERAEVVQQMRRDATELAEARAEELKQAERRALDAEAALGWIGRRRLRRNR